MKDLPPEPLFDLPPGERLLTRRNLCLSAALLGFASTRVSAQAYPSKPISLVVPFAAGGSSDTLGRSFAQGLSEQTGQQVIVVNRGGAGGLLGSQSVARSPADGYTLLFGTIGTHAIAAALKKTLPYDIEKDFVPVARIQDGPMVLVVNPSLPATNLKELIAYARSHPGQISYASAGPGSISHLAGELLRAQWQIDIVHVPYKGGGAALPDLLGGQVHMMIETIPNTIGSIAGGKLRALAITSAKRSPQLPDVPTFAELGSAKMDINAWTGLFAPAQTPAAVIDRLSADIRKIGVSPDYITRTQKGGSIVSPDNTSAQFGAFVHSEVERWKAVAASSGIEPE